MVVHTMSRTIDSTTVLGRFSFLDFSFPTEFLSPLIFYHLTQSTSLYFIQCLHGLNYNRVLVRNSGAATDRTVLKPPASMIVIPTKPTSPATKRTNHTFPQPPATTTASPTKPTNPTKRTKKPRTSKLELCIIIFLGLAWVLAIQISYDSIYHLPSRATT